MPATVDGIATGFAPGAVDAARYNHGNIALVEGEVFALMAAEIPAGSRVLDVGCGSGGFGAVLVSDRGCEVTGIEPSEDRAARSRERGLNVRTGLFDRESVRDLGGFDAVVFADVLEHLADPTDALRLAKSLLKPGGRVVISVPNVAHWTVRIDLLRGNFRYQSTGIMDATHLRWFTRETLLNVVSAAGFEPMAVTVTAGKWMWDYERRKPWKWVAKPRRDRLVDRLTRTYPLLFGCQHIVRADARAE